MDSKARVASLLVICSTGVFGSPSHGQEPARRVLMLHAFNYTFPATTLVGESARKRLLDRSTQKIEIDADFLDLARVTDPAHEARTAEFLAAKYARTRPDVVMTLGSAGLPFIMRHRDAIAPGVPVVFTGVSPQTYAALQPPADVTGIITEFNLDKTLALAEALQPDARRLVVIAGSGATDRRWYSVARTIIESRGRKFETTYLFDVPHHRMIAELSRAPPEAIVILLTVFADSEGRTFIPAEVATGLAAISRAPVYAPYDTYIGNGIVGGFVETFESVGVAAADLVLDLLSGKDAAALPPRSNPGQSYRVDFRAMERWKLPESRLPTNTIVSFKDPGIWERHRGAVLATVLILLFQSLFISALLVQRHRARRAEGMLGESEERMTFTAASLNVGLWQFNRKTHELWATDHCRTLFGLGSDVPLSRNTVMEAIVPEDRAIAMSAFQEAAGQSAVSEVRVGRGPDAVHWLRIRTRSHSGREGTAEQVNGIFIDVTDQKAAEAEAALQRREVAHLMRASVLGQLSGAIAHEIHQPLTAILSNAQAALHMVAQPSPDLAEIRETLQDIVDENNRAGEVVRRLRGLLRKDERKWESVDLNELVRSTLALLNSELIDRRINVGTDLDESLPATAGDPIQLQQVLLNLIMNAMDAMAASAVAERQVMVSTISTRGGGIDVLVKDRGSGIPAAGEGRLFEPFFTTKQHGLGLGLTICSTIIQAHGGTLRVANDRSGGVLAAFSLPAHEIQVAAQ